MASRSGVITKTGDAIAPPETPKPITGHKPNGSGCAGKEKGGAATPHPRTRSGFSLITLLSRYLHEKKRAGSFRPTTQSRPWLGLVVRCGDLALSQKRCFFVRFFTCSQNTKITPFSLIPKVFGHV